MTTAPVIYTAPAGTRWLNCTGALAYQFVCALTNTCPRCLPYHLRIAAWWPLGLHPRCQCDQLPIEPGQEAPLVSRSLDQIVHSLPAHEQLRVLGKTTMLLIGAGIVGIDQVVTKNRTRPPGEVIARAKLSDEQLKAAGVRRVPDPGRGSEQARERANQDRLARDLLPALEAHEALAAAIGAGLGAGAGAALGFSAEELGRGIAEWKRPVKRGAKAGGPAGASTLIHEARHE